MKILYVEDEIAHVELTQRTLEDNLQVKFALFHGESIQRALELLEADSDIDLVLTDLRLPDGSGLDLLQKIRARPSPPAVVLVTGQGDEEVAVMALKAGAADYLVKQSDYLHRLPVVIMNAVAQNRLLHEQAALREAEIKYQSLIEQTPAVVFLNDVQKDETILYMSPRIEELTGYTPDEWRADSDMWIKSIHPDDRERISQKFNESRASRRAFLEEYRIVKRDGRVIWIKEHTDLISGKDGDPLYWQGILLDITKEKENEAALQQQLNETAVLHSVALATSTAKNLDELIQFTTDIICDALHHDNCGVLLLSDDGRALKPHSSYRRGAAENYALGVPLERGITGRVATTGRAIRSGDVSREPAYLSVMLGIQSELCVPIIVNRQIIGVINAESKQADAYTERDERLLATIANNLGTALERLRLFREEQRRAMELDALYQIAKSLTEVLIPEVIAKKLIEAMENRLGYENGAVITIDKVLKLQLPLAVSSKGLSETEYQAEINRIRNMKIRLDQGIAGWVARNGKSVRIGDVRKDPRYFAVRQNILSALCVPLIAREKVIGSIILESPKLNAYTEHDEGLLTALANSAAIALENAHLYDEIQRRLREVELINRFSSSVRLAQSPSQMIPALLNEVLDLINTPHGSIWLYDHSTNMLNQHLARGADAALAHTTLKSNEGLAGHVFTTAKIYTTPDIRNDPLLSEGNKESIPPGLAGICIPIQSTAGPVGTLMISTESGRQVTELLDLLAILAEITGNAIHRLQLYEQSREQVRRLTTLRDIDAVIASSFDLRLTLSILADQAIDHLGVDAVDIGLYHSDLQSLAYLASAGFRAVSPTRPQIRIGEGLAGQVIMQQRNLRLTDLQNAPEARREMFIKREGFVSYIGIPLIVKGQIKGIFEVFHRSVLSTTPEWMEFLQTLAGQAAIAIDNSQLFENLQRSNQELVQAYDTTLEGWARALELRDRETEGHTRRVTDLTLRLAKYMGIADDEMVDIHRGVLLHDIGKMGVPDHILKKTGPLTGDEWNEMRQHPVYAYNLLSPISYLRGALDIPYCHHEHWDGSGYPRGLRGEQIPLAARIFSIVDIWDALLSDRPYRKAWARPKVKEYIREISGQILDPKIVDVFLGMIEEED